MSPEDREFYNEELKVVMKDLRNIFDLDDLRDYLERAHHARWVAQQIDNYDIADQIKSRIDNLQGAFLELDNAIYGFYHKLETGKIK